MNKPRRVIQTEFIPKNINKKQRARLIHLQQMKVKRHLANNFFVWEPQSMEVVTPFNRKLEEVAISQNMAECLKTIQIKWRVNCYILSREKNGKNKLQSSEVLVDTPCKHDEIREHVADYHWQLVDEFKESRQADNFISAAWIATEKSLEPTDEEAYNMFEQVGAWKIPTDWEEEQGNPLDAFN